jgi:hypothetical protein
LHQETAFAVIRDVLHGNAVLVFPSRAQETHTPFFLNDHSIDVPSRGQSREFVVKTCGLREPCKVKDFARTSLPAYEKSA